MLRVVWELNGQHQNFSMWNSVVNISRESIIDPSNLEIIVKSIKIIFV